MGTSEFCRGGRGWACLSAGNEGGLGNRYLSESKGASKGAVGGAGASVESVSSVGSTMSVTGGGMSTVCAPVGDKGEISWMPFLLFLENQPPKPVFSFDL